ncbi:substrate-binding domain-containing protein [Halocatena salina]|uniref:Substrate-binding domain-containing protein n=1 Tax=Halocatena salina TaxID=2934340 RepID=A0A8U0A1C0_9EURY|nr:substrate-binding domain-containing protein [Halocatena salina]UPM42971.1 substrate-binding domain-containing protein [Halocatena salina]
MFDNNSLQRSRRGFLQTAGVTTAGIALSGCTSLLGGSSSDSGSVTIKTRHYPTGEMDAFLDKHTKKFKDETGITVEYETMQWANGKTKQTTSMQNRSGPDVGEIPSTYIPTFANLDGFEDITTIDVDIDKSSFFDSPNEIGNYKGEFIGMPWFWGPRAHLSYMPSLKKAGIDGPPSTWNEMVQQGKSFNDENPDSYLFGIPAQENVSHFFADFLWQNGGTLLTDDNTKAAFDSDRAVEALNFYKDLQSNHSVMPKETAEWKGDARDNAFTSHKIQSTWASLATVDVFLEEEEISESDITISKLPAGPNGESATFYGLELIGIHPWTDHPKESAKWLKYLARPEVNADIAEMTGFLPAVKESFKRDRFQTPVWQGFKKLTSTGKTFPQVDGWSQVEAIINDAVSGVLVDAATGKWSEGDTRKALKTAAKQANKELE